MTSVMMSDFESLLKEVCESILSGALGESGCRATFWHLERLGVNLNELGSHPAAFDDALATIFGESGTVFLEMKIVSKLASVLQTPLEKSDLIGFTNAVARAKARFEARPQERPSSS